MRICINSRPSRPSNTAAAPTSPSGAFWVVYVKEGADTDTDNNPSVHNNDSMGRKDVDAPDDDSFQRLPDAKQGEAHL